MAAAKHILGVILAGGQARRMGGGDKGLADLGGTPMLSHVIARFAPQVAHLILNANGDPARFAGFGLPVVPDLDARALGPMSGLAAAMDWAANAPHDYTAIATVTTDVPFIPVDLVANLAAAAEGGAAIAVSGDRRHPAIALWPLSLSAAVATALEANELSVNAFAARQAAIEVLFPFSETAGAAIDPFFNANTSDDLETARQLIARQRTVQPHE
ncbi:MAG: molybdenum cofactor guanylyltransferase MobA [Hyphomicrobium sp.]